MEKLPIYSCLIEETDEVTGVYAISFVDSPANEVNFIALKEQQKEVYLSKDTQKRILTGVVLRPDQLIYRNSPEFGECYIQFTAEQIEKISHKMMKTGLALYNTTHQHQEPLNGNYLTELWIIEDPQNDKSKALGFADLPKGTLMCSYKIEDSEYWQSEVMTGNVRGFSLEGFFNQVLIKNNFQKMSKKRKQKTLLQKIKEAILSALDDVESNDSTQSGESYRVFVLSDGSEVFVDDEGLATLNDEQLPAGEHTLADGDILVIDESSKFVETKEPNAKADDPAEATAKEILSKNKNMKSKSQKLEGEEPNESEDKDATIASLKKEIDDLKKQIADMTKEVEEVAEEIHELKKQTPSAKPTVPKKGQAKDVSKMTNWEKLAMRAQNRQNSNKQ